jgi:hypothetical protein
MIVIIISYYYILLFDRSRKQIKKYALDLLCEGKVSYGFLALLEI